MMARKDVSLLGIDLHEDEIRVVQVKSRANKTVITQIARAPMPAGGIVRGKVMQPSSVAIALRLLMNTMNVGSSPRAVFGVLGDTTTLRTLPVPPVPDNDLGMIVAGEVEHYGIVKTDGGTHDFLKLFPPPKSSDGDNSDSLKPVNVTIVALEEDVIANLREAASEANITIEAIEPTQYGMYRTQMIAATGTVSSFGLMVNPANTDIAISYKNNLVAYRRVDVGSRSMLANTQIRSEYGYVDPNQEMFVDEFASEESYEPDLNFQAVDNLSIEVQRTLDYYQREFPTVGIGDRIYLVLDDQRLAPLAEELSQRLGVSVETVQPAAANADNAETAAELNGTSAATYSAAFGLATQGAILTKIPRIDLFTKERFAVKKAETKRNFKGSVITSLVSIALGYVGYTLYAKQISSLELYTKQKQDAANQIRQSTDKEKHKRATEAQQYKALQHEGEPITAVMDFIANNLGPSVGLAQVSIFQDMTVEITGEATNQGAVIDTLSELQKCPVLQGLHTVNFKSLSAEEGYGVSFQFKGSTVSIDKIAYADDSKKAVVDKKTTDPKKSLDIKKPEVMKPR